MILQQAITKGPRFLWNPFEPVSRHDAGTFLAQCAVLGSAADWRLLLAYRHGQSYAKVLLGFKDWVIRLTKGVNIFARPTRFSALWRDADVEWLYYDWPALASIALRIAIEDSVRHLSALGPGRARLLQEAFAHDWGLPTRIETKVSIVPAHAAISLLDEWPADPEPDNGTRTAVTGA